MTTPTWHPQFPPLNDEQVQEYVNDTYAALYMDCWEVHEIAHILRAIGVTPIRVERAEDWAHQNLFSARSRQREVG